MLLERPWANLRALTTDRNVSGHLSSPVALHLCSCKLCLFCQWPVLWTNPSSALVHRRCSPRGEPCLRDPKPPGGWPGRQPQSALLKQLLPNPAAPNARLEKLVQPVGLAAAKSARAATCAFIKTDGEANPLGRLADGTQPSTTAPAQARLELLQS